MTTTKENQFLTDISLREKCITHVEVLEKVKNLLVLPATESVTLNQMAEFYGVKADTLNKCYKSHYDEVDMDGVFVVTPKTYKEILKRRSFPFKNFEQQNGKMIVHIAHSTDVVIPNRGIKLFPKRAVLRVGMLLTQSEVAKQVRTQLLNVIELAEKEKPDILTQHIDEEESLYLALTRSMLRGDTAKMFENLQNVIDYQNRYKIKAEQQLEEMTTANKLLKTEILTLSDRASVNRAVRCLSVKICKSYAALWNIIYTQLNYKYSINLKKRGKKPYLSHLKDEEYPCLQQTILAIAEEYGLNSADFLAECEIVKAGVE